MQTRKADERSGLEGLPNVARIDLRDGPNPTRPLPAQSARTRCARGLKNDNVMAAFSSDGARIVSPHALASLRP